MWQCGQWISQQTHLRLKLCISCRIFWHNSWHFSPSSRCSKFFWGDPRLKDTGFEMDDSQQSNFLLQFDSGVPPDPSITSFGVAAESCHGTPNKKPSIWGWFLPRSQSDVRCAAARQYPTTYFTFTEARLMRFLQVPAQSLRSESWNLSPSSWLPRRWLSWWWSGIPLV